VDGLSSLVRIPALHAGGREFESLPIHSFSSSNSAYSVFISIGVRMPKIPDLSKNAYDY
jgi:hypothetical protein